MFVKPQHDHVPDPQRGGYLPVEGRHVEPGPYWWRRVADGDVVEVDPPVSPPAPPPAPPPDVPIAPPAPDPESPPTAGSSVSEPAISQPRTARKGAQA